MAVEDRETDPPLIQRLLEKSSLFSFFQAIYILERYVSSIKKTEPLGHQGPVESEAIRFKADPSLAFPLSDIVAIERADENSIYAPLFYVTTSFLGLYGPSSPLPDFYTEDILQEDSEESYVKDFLDVFHHRLLSLFYRAWLKYRYYIQFASGGEDEFSQRVFSLIGMGTRELTERLHIPPVRLLRYAGLFTQQSRSATALEGFLSDYFGGFPVHIEECVGRWVKIEKEDQISLGVQSNQLGKDTVIGKMMFDKGGKFRISIKLMKFHDFVKFLPDGDCYQALIEITRLFLHAPLEFEEELILPGSEVPSLSLASSGGQRLGWTSWLVSKKTEDIVSVVFN